MTSVLPAIDGLLLDMDGVLTVSWEPLPGAVAAFTRLRAAGLPLRILTNTTGRSRVAIATGLRRHGFEIADDEVLSAAVAAGIYLKTVHPGARVFLLGDAKPEDLPGVDLVGLDDRPSVVLMSGADESYRFDTMNRVYRLLRDGAAFVTMHRTMAWLTREGICLDAGAYVAGLECALGRSAVVTGKPSPDFFAAGLAALDLPAARVAMVGDDIDGDVLAAQAVGLTGILVRTGKFRPDALGACRRHARPRRRLDRRRPRAARPLSRRLLRGRRQLAVQQTLVLAWVVARHHRAADLHERKAGGVVGAQLGGDLRLQVRAGHVVLDDERRDAVRPEERLGARAPLARGERVDHDRGSRLRVRGASWGDAPGIPAGNVTLANSRMSGHVP